MPMKGTSPPVCFRALPLLLLATMRLLLAIFLPWVQFFTIGRPFAGIICLILQITLIGWIPAAIWSTYALSQYKTDKKIEAALNRRSRQSR
ncbi:hypothetical protein Cmtc_62150 [Cupriavidus sp. TKC]|nr:hypothetical protein Cmtc_62150 [Cupriavidus sp. TKC]